MKIFYKIAAFLQRKIEKLPFGKKRRQQLSRNLERLHGSMNREEKYRDYCVRKIVRSMVVGLIGMLLAVLVYFRDYGNGAIDKNGEIERGEYGDEVPVFHLEGKLSGESFRVQLPVQNREWTIQELNESYETFREELPGLIVGKNEGLDRVSVSLNLQEQFEGYPFSLEWESDTPDCMGNDGSIYTEESAKVSLKAIIGYEPKNWQREQIFAVQIIAPVLTQNQQIQRELENLLTESEGEHREDKRWTIPNEWNGEFIIWRQVVKSNAGILLLLSILVSVSIYYLTDWDLVKEIEKQKQQMKLEYPNLLHKLTLYLGAGLPVRAAMRRLADDYLKRRQEGEQENPIYEEVIHLCRELQLGVSEAVAYVNFGRKTGVQEYIRLGTLLSQDLKKGGSFLIPRLREEVSQAFAARIQLGKRMGEEAATKLLLPMVMMLLVVMLILMIPAFSSMGV